MTDPREAHHNPEPRDAGRAFLRGVMLAYAAAVPISIAAAQPLSYLATLCWVVLCVRRRSFGSLLRSPFFWPILLFAAVASASVIWSVRPAVSADKLRHILLLPIVFALPFAFEGREGEGWRMAACFVAGATVLSAFDLVRVPLEVLGGTPLFDTGNMRDPQMYMVSVCLLVAAIAWRGPRRGRAALVGLLALNALGLVLHFKRGAWFACVFGLVVMALAARRKRWLVIVAACALALLAVPQVRERLSLLEDVRNPEMGGRYVLWTHVAPQLLRQYPQGMGWAAIQHEDLARFGMYVQPKLSHLHNNVIHTAVELGWPGLAVWLGWMGLTALVFFRAYVGRRESSPGRAWLALGCLGGFAGLMMNGMVEYNFGDTEILMLACLLMAFGAYLVSIPPRHAG
jgi:O-antigen ligase